MSKDLSNRKRRVNVESLTPEQADAMGEELGKKIAAVTDDAAKKINEYLAVYGLQAKIQYCLVDKEGNPLKT